MNKYLTMVIAYLFKYLKCIIIMLLTAGLIIAVLKEANIKIILPVLCFELFAYSIVSFVVKFLSRKKNPNFKRIWEKHEELLDELKKSNNFDEFKYQNTLLSKANAFKNTYDLYKVSFKGSNILNVDEFREKFDNGELTNYIINNSAIETKYKNQILRLYKDSGVDRASDTIIDEAKNGKNSTYQRLMFTYIPYLVIGAISLAAFIFGAAIFAPSYLIDIAIVCGASVVVIMLVIYFEFKGKFETMLQSIVVMNNMIQYFLGRKKEIPQFSRDTDAMIAFYERKKAE